jgi:S-adenosylmethionine:tRNA ribosyltransferase-isomerase
LITDYQPPILTVDDFDYVLPPELIAQRPSPERTGSRLLCLDRTGRVADRRFADLPACLRAGDLLVFNDTRVAKARLLGRKTSGRRVEALVERAVSAHEALAHVRASKTPRAGTRLEFDGGLVAEVIGREEDLFRLRFPGATVLDALEAHGRVPLPPYIEHDADATDEQRYQTVYARHTGAAAAPTAGLHFDEPLLDRLRATGVELAFLTLHVGAGTFQPVRAHALAEHRMHSEWYEIPAATAAAVAAARAAGRSVIAVGTTSLRALEAAASDQGKVRSGAAETTLFITPGYAFRVVDRLVTNFHLPRSTLLMLVSAFAGVEPMRRAYAHAVAARYRFFSYGDAMLIDRAAGPAAR